MKKLYFFSMTTILLLILVSCPTEANITDVSTYNDIIETQDLDQKWSPEIDTTHFIVRYPTEWTDAQKDDLLNKMPAKKKEEKCDCGDSNLVQWTWDYENFSSAEIQSAGNSLKGGPGKAQGDWPFTFHLPKLKAGSYNVTDSKLLNEEEQGILDSLKQSLLATDITGKKINIAIIDTGIDYYKNRDQEPFLYKTENLVPGCVNDASGWNFIFDTKSVTDDHGHGTYVTRIITTELQKLGIGYRILPIKAFNKKGEGNYWDIVCALSYIKELQHQIEQDNSKDRLHIVNASFGYSFFKTNISPEELDNYKNNSIVKELIDSLNQSITFIASAGNININIDENTHENFPASFTSENIIGVGGYINTNGGIDTDGNFGPISIDVAAPYTGYKFDFIKESVSLTGSSFSAAYTSTKIAEVIKSLQANSIENVVILPSVIKANFYEPNNNWISIDAILAQKISNGRFHD